MHPDDVHQEKCSIEESKAQEEVNLTKPLIHHAAEHLWEPVVDTGKDGERGSTEKNVVDVTYDEVGVVNVHVNRSGRHEDSGKATNDEHRNESNGVQHR